MVYKIAVCDDDENSLEILSEILKRTFEKQNISIQMFSYSKSRILLERLKQEKFHALFLDISMPEMNGIVLGRKILELNLNPALVYITSHEEYVYQSFSARPLRYIRKSRVREEINDAVRAVMAYIEKQQWQKLVVESDNKTYSLQINSILYISSDDKYQEIVMNDEKLIVRNTMKYLEENLIPRGFIRIHRAYLVNSRCIFSMEKDKVFLDNGNQLPISRYRINEVKEAFRRIMMQ